MTRGFMTVFGLWFAASAAHAGGLVEVACTGSARAALDRLEVLAKARGLEIFARIDHAAGARKVDMALRPTELLIFGHPRGGTPLMQCAQSYGLDLPLRVAAWEDAAGRCRFGYAGVDDLLARHGEEQCAPMVKKLGGVVASLVDEAAGAQPAK